MFNTVLIIPTGVGAEIGGHAGDGNPVAKLIGSVCDKLILHPNVVNASDINEMPDNALYVEGSILDRFLESKIGLQEVKSNKVLVAVNAPVSSDIVNAVSAARATLGLDAVIVELKTQLRMVAARSTGSQASGDVYGWEDLVEQVSRYDFDALAIASLIEVEMSVAIDYLTNGGINPWGGVEAKASRLIAEALNKPVAHAPVDPPALKNFRAVVDPRMAAEMVSCGFLHCVLKGLQKAPRVGRSGSTPTIMMSDVDCMVSPWGLNGRPHRACLYAGVPIITVKENKTIGNVTDPNFIEVDNYLEAVGMIQAMKIGITSQSVRRPLEPTTIERGI